MAEMIPHHAAAAAMARMELARGTHPQLKTMAREIIVVTHYCKAIGMTRRGGGKNRAHAMRLA